MYLLSFVLYFQAVPGRVEAELANGLICGHAYSITNVILVSDLRYNLSVCQSWREEMIVQANSEPAGVIFKSAAGKKWNPNSVVIHLVFCALVVICSWRKSAAAWCSVHVHRCIHSFCVKMQLKRIDTCMVYAPSRTNIPYAMHGDLHCHCENVFDNGVKTRFAQPKKKKTKQNQFWRDATAEKSSQAWWWESIPSH